MPYVITEPCIGTKNAACTEVCPVDCIHSTDDEPQFYIDPDICIECEQCLLVCPVNAIYLHLDLPPEVKHFQEINANFYLKTKETPKTIPMHVAREMIQSAHHKARDLGISVTAVVTDEGGTMIALGRMDEAWPLSVDLAMNKAFTAATIQLPTHQLGAVPNSRWFKSFVYTTGGRIVNSGGGMPILQGVNIVGAVGVHGGTPEQDQQCCRAAAAIAWGD